MSEYVCSDSWEAYGKKYAIKHCDNSFFEGKRSRIPVRVRYFFEADSLVYGQEIIITLKYDNQLYKARIYLSKDKRVQISWYSDLGNLFNSVYKKNGSLPIARFDRMPNISEGMLFSVALINESQIMLEEKEDRELVAQINDGSFPFSITETYAYTGKPKKKSSPVLKNGLLIYPRDPEVSRRALILSNNLCEVDPSHKTFIRRTNDRPYTEPHHLVPISAHEQFDVSLDVEENIVSLCSNCHNQIHYGKDADLLVRDLYRKRKQKLESTGIYIDEDALLKYYR